MNKSNQKRLIVINSVGPMGTTLLAGLCEKFGACNVPFRKFKLHEYLMGEIGLNSGFMQNRLRELIKGYSVPSKTGGVSVLDRDNQNSKILCDENIVQHDLNELDQTEFSSVAELYIACREVFNKSVIYKPMADNYGFFIELTVDFHEHDTQKLYKHYMDAFDDVKFIHMHRDFDSWLNALASQKMVRDKWKDKCYFFPNSAYNSFTQYEESVDAIPGLHITLDDIFSTDIDVLAQRLTTFLGVPDHRLNLQDEQYDLYGKLISYKDAFTPFDDKVTYLRPQTLKYFHKLINLEKINHKLFWRIARGRYIFDMFLFNLRKNG